MSSGSTVTTASEDFVAGGKLLVHVAENGHSFEFECEGTTPVEAIQRSIEYLCGVSLADQLLLCKNISLDPQQVLAYYKLPQDDREVFLYNKSRLHADSPQPAPEIIEIPEPQMPSPPSASQCSHPLDNATDPAMKALASYEQQFRYHFQLANAVYGSSQAKFEVCKRLLRELQVQERALDTARGNLEHTYRKLQQRYNEFVRCFGQQNRYHSELLANFARDVERLRSLKLHPSLQSEGRKCLLDLVKEGELRKWADVCSVSHRQFEVKVSQLKQNFAELRRRLESVFSGMTSSRSRDLEVVIKEHHRVLNDQKSVMQSLSKDVNTVKKLVDDCLNCQLSASIPPHDAVSALGPMYSIHRKNHLTKVQTCDQAISKLLDKCKNKKNDMNSLVHGCMQTVKSVQFCIRDMMNELHAFQEVMGHQDKDFENLKFVSGISHAYRACLAEVVRRKSSLKLYMGLAGQLAEKLGSERESEIRRREEFFKSWGKYIPHDILASMGLFDSPSHCDVNISPFDTNLLDIDVADVERFAPQHVVGVSKFERSGEAKSSLETSSDSHERSDSVEILDECGSINIAGTNKLEVENAWLKAELASAIAIICSFNAETGYISVDDGRADDMVKDVKEKTLEALHLKDEYAKHLQTMLDMRQGQCLSYEKRIQELELRLKDEYIQGQQLSSSKDALENLALKSDDKPDVLGVGESNVPFVSSESMDEASCMYALAGQKADQVSIQSCKQEGLDENMADLSSILNPQSGDSARDMDSSMLELLRGEQVADSEVRKDVTVHKHVDENGKALSGNVDLAVMSSCSADNMVGPLDVVSGEGAVGQSKAREDLLSELQNALLEKSKQFEEAEIKLKAAIDEINSLKRELDTIRDLLDESQLNCAHLENCLHQAREEAHTNLCAADRKASEYSALRTTAVKTRSLLERFRSCVTSPVGVASFSDSLRQLALSLASSASEDEDDGLAEFRVCIRVLADKVAFLTRHRQDLLERLSRAEATHGLIVKELEEKVKSLYTKHQLDKQAKKEKISFARFEVHELAAFVLNSNGHYEAINRNCSNYFLSAESVALFTEHHLNKPAYIIGQIVHIERQIVTSSFGDQADVPGSDSTKRPSANLAVSNPYNLPVGCEYFIVTIAMLPDTIHSTPPS